jgi:hypothetical protein
VILLLLAQVFEPKEIDELLANPGMGWQTSYCFADEDKNLGGLPSSVAFFGLHWSDVEPAPGRIERIDALLERARKAGQRLAFRIMCADSDKKYKHVPDWLACRGFDYSYEGRKHWIPDFEDREFQRAHFRMIEELGRRYDGHADLDSVDIGSVGLWGEWHMSGTGLGIPALPTRLAVIDAWRRAFVTTPLLMQLCDDEATPHALNAGAGWRVDCLGDFSPGWSHMKDLYPGKIKKYPDAWKSAPVAFETCWDMRRWKQQGWDAQAIFDFALEHHGSVVCNKSAPLPEGAKPQVERLLRRLGYRLVLRRLKFDGGRVSMSWENVGVAPPYREYVLAVRIGSGITRGPSVKGRLPGLIEREFAVSGGAGELCVAVLDPATSKPAIRLAIAGRAQDGWYPLGRVP